MDRFHYLSATIHHFLKAKGPDRIHSPFIFDLYYHHLRHQHPYYAYREIENYYSTLSKSDEQFESVDLGAGTVHHNKTRTVGKLVATSSTTSKSGQLLFKLAQFFKPETILELGTAFGKSTAYLSKGCSSAKVYTLEGDPTISSIAKKSFAHLALESKVELITGSIDTTLPTILNNLESVDLAFIDANHTYQATLNYYQLIYAKCKAKSVLIFDDIYWSKEMTKAWLEITKRPEVNVVIDTGNMGIVLFRKEQIKEYFRIRL